MLYVNTRSAEVKGVPSCHLAFGCSRQTVSIVPSAFRRQVPSSMEGRAVASWGRKLASSHSTARVLWIRWGTFARPSSALIGLPSSPQARAGGSRNTPTLSTFFVAVGGDSVPDGASRCTAGAQAANASRAARPDASQTRLFAMLAIDVLLLATGKVRV